MIEISLMMFVSNEKVTDGQTLDRAPVDVLVLWFLQRGKFVEQIGHIGQIEFRISADHICGRDELSTAESIGLLQHTLGSLDVIFFL